MHELGSKTKAVEYTSAQKQSRYSQLIGLESQWKVKRYWAFAMFIKKFGHKPAGYTQVSAPAGAEVTGWCKSQFIADKHKRKSA